MGAHAPDLHIELLNSEGDDINPTTLAQLMARGRSISIALDSLDWLAEPMRTTFKDIKNRIDSALQSVAITDAVPAATRANSILFELANVMQHTQMLIDNIKQKPQVTLNSATLDEIAQPRIETELNSRITKGELFTKKDHETALNSAVEAAVNKAKNEWQTALNRLATRRSAVEAAKLPMPADAILNVEKDEEWTTALNSATDRLGKITGLKLKTEHQPTPDRLKALAWGADKDSFEAVFASLEIMAKGASTNNAPRTGALPVGGPPNPAAPAAPAEGAKKRKFVL